MSKRGISGRLPLLLGFTIYGATSIAMLALAAAGEATAVRLTIMLVLSAFAYGMIGPNASHGALQSMPEIAGIVGAMLTSLQMAAAVLASAIVATAYGSMGIYAMLVPMLAFGALTAFAFATMVRR
jgi:DHA1 family bicyclomycin/chloramphenicol resistance-like MFS transporter